MQEHPRAGHLENKKADFLAQFRKRGTVCLEPEKMKKLRFQGAMSASLRTETFLRPGTCPAAGDGWCLNRVQKLSLRPGDWWGNYQWVSPTASYTGICGSTKCPALPQVSLPRGKTAETQAGVMAQHPAEDSPFQPHVSISAAHSVDNPLHQ